MTPTQRIQFINNLSVYLGMKYLPPAVERGVPEGLTGWRPLQETYVSGRRNKSEGLACRLPTGVPVFAGLWCVDAVTQAEAVCGGPELGRECACAWLCCVPWLFFFLSFLFLLSFYLFIFYLDGWCVALLFIVSERWQQIDKYTND